VAVALGAASSAIAACGQKFRPSRDMVTMVGMNLRGEYLIGDLPRMKRASTALLNLVTLTTALCADSGPILFLAVPSGARFSAEPQQTDGGFLAGGVVFAGVNPDSSSAGGANYEGYRGHYLAGQAGLQQHRFRPPRATRDNITHRGAGETQAASLTGRAAKPMPTIGTDPSGWSQTSFAIASTLDIAGALRRAWARKSRIRATRLSSTSARLAPTLPKMREMRLPANLAKQVDPHAISIRRC
jgi:hypothetical protein